MSRVIVRSPETRVTAAYDYTPGLGTRFNIDTGKPIVPVNTLVAVGFNQRGPGVYAYDDFMVEDWSRELLKQDKYAGALLAGGVGTRVLLDTGKYVTALSSPIHAQSVHDIYGYYAGLFKSGAEGIQARIGYGAVGGGVPATPKWRIF